MSIYGDDASAGGGAPSKPAVEAGSGDIVVPDWTTEAPKGADAAGKAPPAAGGGGLLSSNAPGGSTTILLFGKQVRGPGQTLQVILFFLFKL